MAAAKRHKRGESKGGGPRGTHNRARSAGSHGGSFGGSFGRVHRAPTSVANEKYELTRPVFFIGFMGAGKTSVSRKLARWLGLAAIDMDTFIVRREDMPITEIFERYGEAHFRSLETEVLAELAARGPALISCGGGIIETPASREVLKRDGFVVHLRTTADESARRISNFSTRPLFNDIESARALCERRMPLYEECADGEVLVESKGVNIISAEVQALLIKEGVLCPQRNL